MRLPVFLLVSAVFQQVLSYNFLVVCPIFAYSHIKFMSKVADTLSDGGHNVTLLQTYMFEHWGTTRLTKNKNINIIDYRMPGKTPDEKNSASAFKYLWETEYLNNELGAFAPMFVLYQQFKPMCDSILLDEELHRTILSKKFDGYVAEAFDFCSLYLGDHLKLNLLPMFSSTKNVPASKAIGEPSLLNYAPTLHTKYGPEQTTWDRMQDISMVTSFYYALANLFDRQHTQASSILNGDVRHWKNILQTSTFFFSNNNPYVGFSLPALEKSVDIGGFTVDTKKKDPVDKEYDEILNLRKFNVLISFGTVVLSADMPQKFKNGIVKMFKNLPEATFIWKYEAEDEEFSKLIPENVILKKWVPQPALLADSRLNLFITHGGLGSTLEVAYSGKPSIVVPIFGDQLFNAKMLSRHGGTKYYNKYDLEYSEKLTESVREVLSVASFNASAHLLAEILRNQPIDPKTNLLRHAEFSAKFGRVHALEPYNVHYNFIEYYMLDAYLCIILLILASDVQVECDSRTISVQIKTENPFVGTVFVKDFASDQVCSSRGTGRLSAFLEFEIGLCGALRHRILNPKGTEVRTTITISFHPYFITKIDRTYHIVCLYKERETTVMNGLSVDEISTISVTRNLSMPVCSYQILESNPSGRPVQFGLIGQQVYHQWKCDSENEDSLCMLVHTCSADDGRGDRAFLIDSNGCAIDRFLLSDIEYPENLLAGQEAHVYKFADRDALFFQCQISITVREPGEECFRPNCVEPRVEGAGAPVGSTPGPYGASKTQVRSNIRRKRDLETENVVDVRVRLSVGSRMDFNLNNSSEPCLLISHISISCLLVYLFFVSSTFVITLSYHPPFSKIFSQKAHFTSSTFEFSRD